MVCVRFRAVIRDAAPASRCLRAACSAQSALPVDMISSGLYGPTRSTAARFVCAVVRSGIDTVRGTFQPSVHFSVTAVTSEDFVEKSRSTSAVTETTLAPTIWLAGATIASARRIRDRTDVASAACIRNDVHHPGSRKPFPELFGVIARTARGRPGARPAACLTSDERPLEGRRTSSFEEDVVAVRISALAHSINRGRNHGTLRAGPRYRPSSVKAARAPPQTLT